MSEGFNVSATFLRSSEDLDDFDDCCNLTNHHSWDRGARPLNTSFKEEKGKMIINDKARSKITDFRGLKVNFLS